MDINTIIAYITSPQLQEKLFLVRIIFIVFSLFFLGVIVYALVRTQYIKLSFLESWTEFFTYRPLGISKFAKQWTKITKRLETADESEAKLAVIEADRMLDDILNKTGHKGEILEERLKQLTPTALPDIDQVLEAHKIRNNIVYDPDYRLSLDRAKEVLAIYEKALRNLEMF